MNGPAKFGLCTALRGPHQARRHDDCGSYSHGAEPVAEAPTRLPVPFQNLSDAAEEAGQSVADFCADAVPGGSVDTQASPATTHRRQLPASPTTTHRRQLLASPTTTHRRQRQASPTTTHQEPLRARAVQRRATLVEITASP